MGGLFDDCTVRGTPRRVPVLSSLSRIAGGSRSRGLQGTHPYSGRPHPGCSARHGRHRPGPDRHRQDGRLSAALLQHLARRQRDRARRPWSWRPRASWSCKSARKLPSSRPTTCRTVPIYGGQRFREQLDAHADAAVNIVVGTPGRVLDHLCARHADLGPRPLRRARRSRPHARHRLPARHREDPAPLPAARADAAAVRHAAAAGAAAGPALHARSAATSTCRRNRSPSRTSASPTSPSTRTGNSSCCCASSSARSRGSASSSASASAGRRTCTACSASTASASP